MDRGRAIPRAAPAVAAYGYVCLDVLVAADGIRQMAGGTAANVAANLSFFGWRAMILGRIGDDPAGRAVVRSLARSGVSTRRLLQDPSLDTPLVLHEVGNGGHTFSFRCPTCSAGLGRFAGAPAQAWDVAALNDRDVFFFDRTAPASLELAENARARGSLVVFEPSVPGRIDQFRRAVRAAHIVKASSERLPRLPAISRAGRIVIETKGAEGLAFWYRGKEYRQAAFSIPIVDAAGAGDWLTAALLEGLRSRRHDKLTLTQLRNILRQSQAFAALACTVAGARGIAEILSPRAFRSRARRLRSGGKVQAPRPALVHIRTRRPTCPDCHAPLPPTANGTSRAALAELGRQLISTTPPVAKSINPRRRMQEAKI